jgi:hypothetical protein
VRYRAAGEVREGRARAADLAPVIAEIRAAGAASLRAIADALNTRCIAAPRGGTWAPAQVRDLLRRDANAHRGT